MPLVSSLLIDAFHGSIAVCGHQGSHVDTKEMFPLELKIIYVIDIGEQGVNF